MEEKKIWDLLLKDIGNEYGVAGLMGNLMAESNLNPLCMTGGESKKWSGGQAYADAVNKGDYSKNYFSRDNIAFGLAQWLYWSRKEALYDYTALKDIGSVEAQIGFLLKAGQCHQYDEGASGNIRSRILQQICRKTGFGG